MDEIDYSKIKVSPIKETLFLGKITDDEYFSEKYSDYISNSRLKLINPDQGGSPEQYFAGFEGNKIYSESLVNGSATHELVLQPEYFELVETVDRPIGKIGFISDIVYKKDIMPTDDEIIAAATEVDYYKGQLTTARLKDVRETLRKYIEARSEFEDKYTGDKELIYLSSSSRDKVKTCVTHLLEDQEVDALLHPLGWFSPIKSENEQAILCDLNVEIEGEKPFILKLKAKLDNYTLDIDNNKIVINDIKTHGRKISEFADAVQNWRYMREMAVYATLISLVADKYYHMVNPKIEANFLVVSTIPDYLTRVYRLRRQEFQEGIDEFKRLLKMVAYYTCQRNKQNE